MGPISYGDKIHLINQYVNRNGRKTYLDTCDDEHLAAWTPAACNGTYHLQTSENPNRVNGSGTWEIEIILQD